MAPIPHGAAARALPPCDLVMKGGVTSGIVYPSLVLKLSEHYRFASIGGTLGRRDRGGPERRSRSTGANSTTAAAPRSSWPRFSRSGSPAPSWASSSRRPPRSRCSR